MCLVLVFSARADSTGKASSKIDIGTKLYNIPDISQFNLAKQDVLRYRNKVGSNFVCILNITQNITCREAENQHGKWKLDP